MSQGEVLAEDQLWRIFNVELVFSTTRLDGVIKGVSRVREEKRLKDEPGGTQRVHEQSHCYSYTATHPLADLLRRRNTVHY